MSAELSLLPAAPDDAESLAELRVAAMRESLERVGRFDPARARNRLLDDFSAKYTRHIEVEGVHVGFVVVTPSEQGLSLDHLYLHPDHQGRGIGAAVLNVVIADARERELALEVSALRESASNRLYARHGFELVRTTEWDNHYVLGPT